MYRLLAPFLFIASGFSCFAQSDSTASLPKYDYQIYLKQPAKELKQLLNYKTCEPIDGNLSESKKTIIMRDYQPGNKVYFRVEYMDGTEEEITRSPCFIDPIIL